MNYKGLPSSFVPSSSLVPLVGPQLVVLLCSPGSCLGNVHGNSAKMLIVIEIRVVANAGRIPFPSVVFAYGDCHFECTEPFVVLFLRENLVHGGAHVVIIRIIVGECCRIPLDILCDVVSYGVAVCKITSDVFAGTGSKVFQLTTVYGRQKCSCIVAYWIVIVVSVDNAGGVTLAQSFQYKVVRCSGGRYLGGEPTIQSVCLRNSYATCMSCIKQTSKKM